MATTSGPTAQSSGTLDVFSAAGLVVLVTGGGTGIGLMMAKALVGAGACRVYIAGRRKEVLEAAADSIGQPEVVVPLVCDVASRDSLASAVETVEKEVGYLNLLICNSGVTGPPPDPKITPETTLEEWRDAHLAVDPAEFDWTLQVNTRAVWYSVLAFVKLLDAGNRKGNVPQSSQVVVTSSIAAFNRKPTGGWAYGVSKAAVTHLVKMLAVALPQWSVRVNCIAPGLFPSQMSANIVRAANDGADWDRSKPVPLPREDVPLGRMGTGDEIAGCILYLASRAGAYCNGNIMVVDGGRLTVMPSTGY